MDLTFQEKSLWVSLLSIGALYGYYFYEVASGAQEPSLSAMLWTMIGIIVLLIVVGLIGCLVPVRRGVSVQPTEALRAEG